MTNEIKRVIEQLSGKTSYGKTKAYFTLTHALSGTDGTVKEIDSIFIDKPEIRIFRGLEYTTVDFVYEFNTDADLALQWEFIQKFLSPENGCFFTSEDIPEFYDDEGALIQVQYLHELVLSIADNEHNGKYSFENLFGNMVTATLVPVRPKDPATILRMVFPTEDVVFLEMEDDVLLELQQAAMKEAESETAHLEG